MKIYIVRHEDRTQDGSFFSPLTKKGLENANNLVAKLKNEKIDLIISSPFIRTLQTVYPYSKACNIKINLEYGLEEINHSDIIAKKNAGINLPEYLCEAFNYDQTYKTIIKPTDIKWPEQEEDVMRRVKKILKVIITKYYNTNLNILLVTHQCPCVQILKIINKSIKVDDNILQNYEKGRLSLVYDNGRVFRKL